MAYNALSISSAAHATVPFENASPTKYIWVSNKGSNTNNGSANAPMKTIQAAVDKAAPGTAIMVKEGTYKENVQLKTDGTTTKPIWLTSADGIGKAKIVAADNNQSVVAGYGEDNWIVKGLAIEGGKNGIQFSQSGSGLKNFSENVVIQENVIKNVKVADGIKLSQAKNHAVVGNHIEGGVGEEGIDNVYTTNSVIAYNTIKNTHGLSAITLKGGSANVKVHHNSIEVPLEIEPATGSTVSNPAATAPREHRCNVILIEDDPLVGEAMRWALEDMGCTVRFGTCVAEAGDLLDGFDPDLVITDFRLPGDQNGLTGIQIIRERVRHPVAACLITGDMAEQIRMLAEQAGIPWLTKPITVDNLIAVVEQACPIIS